MHHYDFHIKDYQADTAHLSNEEDLCYRRLLDLYYDTEHPIPLETQWVARRLRVGIESVSNVLKEFFIKGQNGWIQARCNDEIARYHALVAKNKANGIKGGRPKKTHREPTGNRLVTQTKANQEPGTRNQSKPLNPLKGVDVAFASFWKAYPRKTAKGAAEKAWAKAKINGDLVAVLKALEAQKQSEQWQKNGGQYIPHPSTWINQKRWLDEIAGATVETSASVGGFL